MQEIIPTTIARTTLNYGNSQNINGLSAPGTGTFIIHIKPAIIVGIVKATVLPSRSQGAYPSPPYSRARTLIVLNKLLTTQSPAPNQSKYPQHLPYHQLSLKSLSRQSLSIAQFIGISASR